MNRPIMHIMSPPGIIFVFVPMQSQKITSSVLFFEGKGPQNLWCRLGGGEWGPDKSCRCLDEIV